jgi:hypothetical protein
MAIKRLTIDGYGQVELNNVAFRRDGRIEAQCAADATDFATAPVENGMLLAVDNVTRTVKFAKDGTLPIALVYSAEHTYDATEAGLKNFKLGKDDVLPRLGYTALADKFTTNCIAYDDGEFATEDTLKEALKNIGTTPIYGGACNIGAIKLSKTAPAYGPVYRVVLAYTMPDGQFGVKLQQMPEIVG